MTIEHLHQEELLSRDELHDLQLKRLRKTLKTASASPHYARTLACIDPEDIRSLDQVRDLPFTTKEDLRRGYPFGFLARDPGQMIRMHASSGTTGSPTAMFYTAGDVSFWADLVARCMHMTGIRAEDTFQNLSGYGLFTGGLGMHYGAERLGCLTIPAGAGNSKRQIKLLKDFKVSCIHIIPSYALHLFSVFRESGLDPRDLNLRIALIGAEPHSEEIRTRIEELSGMKAYNSYGLSEMNGPGVAFECRTQNGMHLWEDAFLAEIIDPKTGNPLPEGQLGELVLTSLNREGMPIVRYRTRDLTRFIPGTCACGREHIRIDRIMGRADDMFILKGVNIYPMQVEQILMSMPEVGQNYLIVLEREGFIDQMRIKVEVRDEFFEEDMRVLKGLAQKITRSLQQEILITPKVDLVEHRSLPRTQGKAERVQDRRK
ncbi:MAG: phenylacetate--CoA ligase [Desulfohalobiaceae bacterium]|nr:phenylacetate--CoA ligase [Desulfohalobiaceae bacterium]